MNTIQEDLEEEEYSDSKRISSGKFSTFGDLKAPPNLNGKSVRRKSGFGNAELILSGNTGGANTRDLDSDPSLNQLNIALHSTEGFKHANNRF